MSLKVLVVDDEEVAREGCRKALSEDPDVSILEASNGREAVEAILDLRPDLVFLDIQMPEMDGFAVLEEVGAALMPCVVFVTAHDEYAMRAFEVNAIDYLLKPVPAKRWLQALARAKSRISGQSLAHIERQVSALLEMIARGRKYTKRLAVPAGGKTALLEVHDIDWIEGAENYARLHIGSSTFMLHVPLATLCSNLHPRSFVRISSLDYREPEARQGYPDRRTRRVHPDAFHRNATAVRPQVSRQAQGASGQSVRALNASSGSATRSRRWSLRVAVSSTTSCDP